jgi:GDP-D-mannose dehydratase
MNVVSHHLRSTFTHKSMPTALITGIGSQDGSYLSEFLLDKGYRLFGTVPDGDPVNIDRIRHLLAIIEIVHDDLLDQNRLEIIFRHHHPDEVYNFAANSVLAASFHQPILATMVLAMGVTRNLEAVRKITRAAAMIKLGHSKELRLGNMAAAALMAPQLRNYLITQIKARG